MPESEWENMEKSAAKRVLAWLTFIITWIQSPAAVRGFEVRPCSCSHALTAESASEPGTES